MSRLPATAVAAVLSSALLHLACGNSDRPNDEAPRATQNETKSNPAIATAQPAKPDDSPVPAPISLPEEWPALKATLAEADRPRLAAGVQPAPVTRGVSELTLPLPGIAGTGETHTRHPWTMPDGHANTISIVRWSDSTWRDVKIDVGVGICPHRGQRLASDVSNTGVALVHYAAPSGQAVTDHNWFLHVNADANLADKAGETLTYHWAVFTY